MSKQTSNKFSPEIRSRAVRLVLFGFSQIGCTAQTLGVGEEGGGRQRQASWRSDRYGPALS